MTKPFHIPMLGWVLAVCCMAAARAEQVEVHDPSMACDAGACYVFSTGPGVTIYSSQDLTHWKWIGRVFDGEPSWARSAVPGFSGHLWAPDIFARDGRFYLYYSVSAFGKNTSAIGVAVNETLDPDSPDYAWVDKGIVVLSVPNRDDWNAIDPAVSLDKDGTPWMAFGSFWDGIKLVRLDPDLTRLAEPQEWYSLARRQRAAATPDDKPGGGAVEAPYIFRKDGWYYLFVSFDLCCRRMNSTYKIMVGRSKSIAGPYVDKAGKPMLQGGGSLVLGGDKDWVALGHNAAYHFDGRDWLVFHAYETADNARQKLRILAITWQDGWPAVDPADLNRNTTELVGPGPPENHH
jgi:arabinan endo-1,5-alpha-L-arabinosidase